MRTNRFLAALLTTATVAVSSPALAGEPLLVPDFTPGSTTEFGLAFLLQDKVIAGLREQGHIVLGNQAAQPVVGDILVACADMPGCPFAALQQLPARAAVVGRVARTADGELTVYVAAYEQGDSRPVDTRDFVVQGGDEDAIVRDVIIMVDDMLSLLGPAPADQLMAAVDLLEAADEPEPEPEPEPVRPDPRVGPIIDPMPPPPPNPEVVRPEPPRDREPVVSPYDYQNADLDQLLEGSLLKPRHVEGLEWHFRRSELEPRIWNRRNSPHAGRVIVELRGGVGIGDVSRSADVRVNVAFDGQNASEWFQEGPTTGTGPRGGLYVGYAPNAWFDIGLGAGLQYGQKALTTGYTDVNGANSTGDDSVTALQFFLEPRVRLYPLPFGPVKPFLGVGADIRMFDPYDIIDPPAVDYPNPPGGAHAGPQFLGGLLFDVGPAVGLFGEASYSLHLGGRATAGQSSDPPAGAPPAPEGQGSTLNLVGGLQFRI